jgi:uncharacterized protein YjbJ (UPF0337 family)
MNRGMIEGHWDEMKNMVKARWGKLTDEDLNKIAGKREKLIGRLQAAYGYDKNEAERELLTFEKEGKKGCGSTCSH